MPIDSQAKAGSIDVAEDPHSEASEKEDPTAV